jgi:hypothetical protein
MGAVRVVAGLCLLLAVVVAPADTPAPADATLREAAGGIYVHGMSHEIAVSKIGEAGVPDLLRLLWEPGFEHRDNVVAFLGFLGGEETVDELLRFLSEQPFPLAEPAEDRALLLIPEMLGRLASRGAWATAVPALLELTENETETRRDLVEMAIRGLMFSGRPEARARLVDLAERRISPLDEFDQVPTARACLEWMDATVEQGAASQTTTGRAAAPVFAEGAFSQTIETEAPSDPAPTVFDQSPTAHQLSIDYANHAALSPAQRMTDGRLDDVFHEATHLIGEMDFAEDLICCATLSRAGMGGTFGQPGDGLDIISNLAEMETVLGDPSARFKVVRQIGWCGGAPVSNAIGCAYLPGWGGAVVRYGNATKEGALWAHEFGHNLGFAHVADVRYIMHAAITGNGGVSSGQCWKYHNPPVGSAVPVIQIGTCSDDDADGVHGVIDNCPTDANSNQADQDGDDAGDVCDNCAGSTNPGQSDGDQDVLGDICDNCPQVDNPEQVDFDRDGYGDACETGALLADANLSGRVDGFDLARLARAFGSHADHENYDRTVDLSRDGYIDGHDLAILALYFGQSSQ